jgi:hypothetical protein
MPCDVFHEKGETPREAPAGEHSDEISFDEMTLDSTKGSGTFEGTSGTEHTQ